MATKDRNPAEDSKHQQAGSMRMRMRIRMLVRIHNTASRTYTPPYLDGLEALRHLEPVAGELLLPLPAGQLTVQHLLLQLLHPLQKLDHFLEQIKILLYLNHKPALTFLTVKICSLGSANSYLDAVLRIPIRNRIHIFLGLPDPDTLIGSGSSYHQEKKEKTLDSYCFATSSTSYSTCCCSSFTPFKIRPFFSSSKC